MLATETPSAKNYIHYTLRMSSYKQFLLPANLVRKTSIIEILFKFDENL